MLTRRRLKNVNLVKIKAKLNGYRSMCFPLAKRISRSLNKILKENELEDV